MFSLVREQKEEDDDRRRRKNYDNMYDQFQLEIFTGILEM